MVKKNRCVELPLLEPLYQTYHYQGPATSIIKDNPSIRNWYLNEAINLKCSRKFLSGFTTPEIAVPNSSWSDTPFIEKSWSSMRFMNGYVNPIIRGMLDKGYYVGFSGVDDYYIPGKTWYKERHFNHDGLICGYNQSDKTYCVFAYDSNWVYRKFWIPQKSFNEGRIAMNQQGCYGHLCSMKPTNELVELSIDKVLENLVKYLDSSFEKYPLDQEGDVYGVVVHNYLLEYIKKLYDGSIAYERMDRRVFRLVWEHKKAMLERIQKIDNIQPLSVSFEEKYKPIVAEANAMRMLYASHHFKRRDSVLPIICDKLSYVMCEEQKILTEFVEALEGGR